ncbi:MAG: hypothetical protein K8F52_09475 [Candidatus Scalindua rubra]|uniref:CDP-diglyceride synthetase/phosphatidate cytidylyltransferase n=2 Tax=Candidatus Scalindua TaxID=236756 RepID=A0A286U0N2_9BACT|nr:hypothetical protein [Candidatus Scalindua japonica]MBZ0108889.1 hypothetical protein [Candidatus Scalindua rubra]GAX61631.1 CDP-diglyceride synthetase/phosphatidate cytidylyltransferase [Candidatus Scalindua japonica]
MIEFLNNNQGLIAAIGVIVSIVIAIIGFCINRNISKIAQNQDIKNNSKGLQGGRDAVDKSINFEN